LYARQVYQQFTKTPAMASGLWKRLSRLLHKKHYPMMSSKPTNDGVAEATTSSGGRDYPKDMIIEEHVPDKDLRSKLINTFLNLEELDPNLFRCAYSICARTCAAHIIYCRA
jgi:hypothetical protein